MPRPLEPPLNFRDTANPKESCATCLRLQSLKRIQGYEFACELDQRIKLYPHETTLATCDRWEKRHAKTT